MDSSLIVEELDLKMIDWEGVWASSKERLIHTIQAPLLLYETALLKQWHNEDDMPVTILRIINAPAVRGWMRFGPSNDVTLILML